MSFLPVRSFLEGDGLFREGLVLLFFGRIRNDLMEDSFQIFVGDSVTLPVGWRGCTVFPHPLNLRTGHRGGGEASHYSFNGGLCDIHLRVFDQYSGFYGFRQGCRCHSEGAGRGLLRFGGSWGQSLGLYLRPGRAACL